MVLIDVALLKTSFFILIESWPVDLYEEGCVIDSRHKTMWKGFER